MSRIVTWIDEYPSDHRAPIFHQGRRWQLAAQVVYRSDYGISADPPPGKANYIVKVITNKDKRS